MNNGVVLKVINKENNNIISRATILRYELEEHLTPVEEYYLLQDEQEKTTAIISVYEEDSMCMYGRGLSLKHFAGEDTYIKELINYVLELKEGFNSFIRLNEEFLDMIEVEEGDFGTAKII